MESDTQVTRTEDSKSLRWGGPWRSPYFGCNGVKKGRALSDGIRMSKVKDPVCGMTVETERAAAKGVYGGETVYFCAAACRTTYERTHRPD